MQLPTVEPVNEEDAVKLLARTKTMSRRKTMALGLSGLAAAFVRPTAARAEMEDSIHAFTGGAMIGEGGLDLTLPEVAENGNAVSIEVNAPRAETILVLAAGNPAPEVARFHFGPLAGAQRASTRIRLAGTQDVLAIAKFADGRFVEARRRVTVIIAGCGG